MKTRKRHTWKSLPILAMVMIAVTLALPTWAQDSIIIDDTIPFNPGEPIAAPLAYHGKVDGTFAVSPTGGATYTVPIEIPTGVGGVQPQIAITYNSQSGMGLAGWGCALSGMSAITRGPKDIFHDGSARGMRYGADDAYYMDGKRLILASGTEGMPNCEYHPEGDPYTSVTVRGSFSATNDERYFEVRSPDGLAALYGSTTASRQGFYSDGGKVAAWYLRSATDALGNSVEWDYARDQLFVYPTYVTYGDGRVEFTYTTLGNAGLPFRLMGVAGAMDRLLTGITCKYGGNTLRRYSLTYDYMLDETAVKFPRLTRVSVSDGNGHDILPLIFSWNGLEAFNRTGMEKTIFTPTVNGSIQFTNRQFTTADINGDGIDDMIEIFADTKSYHHSYGVAFHRSYYDNHSGQWCHYSSWGHRVNAPVDFFWGKTNNEYNVGDFDGDGMVDFTYIEYVNSPMDNLNYTAFSFEYGKPNPEGPDSTFDYTVYCQHSGSTQAPLYSVADIDNDGKSEIVILERESLNGYRCFVLSSETGRPPFNYGYGQLYLHKTASTFMSDPRKLFVEDFDGDGLRDIIVICDEGYRIYWNQTGNQGSPFAYNEYSGISGTSIDDAEKIDIGDFNGDGLPDFVMDEHGDWIYYFALNNGDGTFEKVLAANIDLSGQATDKDDNRFTILVEDFDHDGKSDMLIAKAVYEHHEFWPFYENDEFKYTDIRTYRSSGTDLSLLTSNRSGNEDDAVPGRIFFGDFDGDGVREFANYGADLLGYTTNSTSDIVRFYHGDNTIANGKLISVTDGLNNLSTFGYASLSNRDVYSREGSATYPLKDICVPLHVVRTVQSPTASSTGHDTPMTETYSYGGLKAHSTGRGILGFATSSVANDVTGATATTVTGGWSAANRYTPSFSTRAVTLADNSVSTEHTAFGFHATADGANYSISTDTATVTDFDGNTETTCYVYDAAKGLTTGQRTYPDGNATQMYKESETANYERKAGKWLPRTLHARQKHKDDPTAFQSTKRVSYNSIGLPDTVTVNHGTPLALTTVYTYDQWGNVTSETASGSGLNTVTTHYEYDPTHRFVARRRTTPASTVTEYTYDAWGNVLTETDATDPANPLATTNAYDGFGNLMHSVSPEGIATSVTRTLSGDLRHYETLEQTDGRPWRTTLRDGLGNVVSTHSVGVMDIAIADSTVFDARGNATKRMATNGALTSTAETAYDLRNRPTSETLSTGSVTTYAYGNRKVTAVTDGKTTETTYDAWGNVKKCQRPYGTVTYAYASNGKPSAASTGNATVTMQYDACGNQTRLVDPDAGTMQYTYNAAGRVVSQTDARGVTTTDSLDALNRVVRKTTGGTVVNYAYGTAGNASQRLTQLTTPTHGISYTYDAYGRVATETRNYGSTQYTFTCTYDSLGNLLQTAYPGNITVSHVYDAYGNEVRMDVDGVPVWQLVSHDGQVTTESLGSPPHPNDSIVLRLLMYGNLTRVTSRDDSGLPASISLRKRDNTPLHSMSFTHDPLTGNLTSRSGMIPGEGELFSYDDEDRLVRYRNDHGHWDDICQYTADGNIQYRTGLGYYDYHPTSGIQPHAVKGVGNTSGRVSGDSHDLSFNDLGKVSYISSHENGSYGIVYGPDGGRWESSLYKTGSQWPDTVRRYVGDMEIVSSGPSEVCRFYYLGHGVVLRKVNNAVTPLYAFTDNLGSVTRLYTVTGTEKFRAQYDPWGVQVVNKNDVNFARGYCGHEMLDDFQLINMNGRMYDPVLGRFLSPDNYVQMPTSAQSFNRYSYCLNNPLKYTDPSGELFGIDDLLLFNIATSAYISAVCGAFNSSMNGGSAFGGAFRGIGSSLLLSIGSYGVGEMFGHGMVSPYNELARGLAHGIVSGTANCIDGGNFCSGFLSGAISSWSSSASKALGASPWASIGLSTISGALSSELAGDSWVGGAINGLMIGALNHEWQYINGENVYVLDEVVCSAPRLSNGGVIAAIHASLDILGMIPAIGEFADGTNAAIYAFQGDMINAGLSAAAMIPFVGNFATGGKYAAKAANLYTKSSLKYGREVHKLYKVDNVDRINKFKEFRDVPGVRPDFVDKSTRTIYELKPNNPRSIKLGINQLKRYKSAFEEYYPGTKWNTILDLY